MDRYERMQSGDWPRDDAASNFRRMSKRVRLTQNPFDWIEDAVRIALALGLLAVLAAWVR